MEETPHGAGGAGETKGRGKIINCFWRLLIHDAKLGTVL